MRKRSAGRRMTPERQQRILDVAVDIAIADGFDAITMQSVAKVAGYPRPVVYDCYPSPEAVILAVLDRESETVDHEIDSVAGSLDASGALSTEELVRIIIARLESIRAQPRTWLLLSVPTEGATETVRARVNDIRETLRESFEHALELAVREQPDPKLDTEVASHLIQDIAHTFAQRMISDPENYTTQRFRASLEPVLATMNLTR
ncbi:TetR/AcrR family transcriptional regulator [Nocardia sp. NBC_01388]|uniref:TetR/AcrR family transcriptional regulator n=1 Tax=Nocardia sp. NBC_01388 TaxID=2903596 RepID=UPI0032466CBD